MKSFKKDKINTSVDVKIGKIDMPSYTKDTSATEAIKKQEEKTVESAKEIDTLPQ